MNEEIKNAVVELENWLSDPQELGKKPVKIEYANSFEDEDIPTKDMELNPIIVKQLRNNNLNKKTINIKKIIENH